MFDKIKAILSEDNVFYVLLILMIGLTSFGLGRWSMSGESAMVQPASIVMSESSRPVSNAWSAGAEADASASAATSGQYVASKNGSKYHLPWCPGAKQMKEENKIWFNSKEEAISKGYTAAANCPGL